MIVLELTLGKNCVAPIEDKMRESRSRWFDHIRRRPKVAPVRACKKTNIRRRQLLQLDEDKEEIVQENHEEGY